MGWSHSVYVAQAGHEHLINTLTLLKPSDRITRYSDYRLDRPRHLVYIDDLCLVGPEECRVELDSLLDQYTQVMTAKRLPPNPLKRCARPLTALSALGLKYTVVILLRGFTQKNLKFWFAVLALS
jgi:hypothetical protein